MIEAANLTERFNDTVAVDHTSAIIRGGSVFGLTGTNGVGRSTFLRLISGVLGPDGGYVTIDRHEVFESIPTKKRFLYISDRQHFSNNITPEEMMRCYREVYQGFDEARFHKPVGNFDLGERRKIHTSSKGTKKQVSVICGVCTGTDYLFCDETFDGLDPVMRQVVEGVFATDMEDRSLTPIIASHNLREPEDICDHVGLLHKGGTPLPEDLDDMKLSIHKIQRVLKPDMKSEDLTSLGKVDVEQRGSLCTITAQGNRGEVEAIMASYEPVFFECTPLSLEEVFISEMEMTDYDIRKLAL